MLKIDCINVDRSRNSPENMNDSITNELPYKNSYQKKDKFQRLSYRSNLNHNKRNSY